MKLIVTGSNYVSARVACALEGRGHSVTVMDEHSADFAFLPFDFAGERMTGNPYDRLHLRQAGIEQCDGFIAAHDSDSVNIVSARVAREAFGIERVALRLRDAGLTPVAQRLGLHVVASIEWSARELVRAVEKVDASTPWEDPNGSLIMVERGLPPGWYGQRLSGLIESGRISLVSVGRFGAAMLYTEKVVGQEGDTLRFICAPEAVAEIDRRLAKPEDYL